MEQSRYRDAMRYLISVGMFQYPNILVAKTFLGKVYFYHFDEPSPYLGPTFGCRIMCVLLCIRMGRVRVSCTSEDNGGEYGKDLDRVCEWGDYAVGGV
jgi:hypothetical protein